MTPLTQQLEDKKKEYRSLKRQHCDDCTKNEECQTCKPEFDNLRKEIAILEQAIAEIKNIQSQQNKIDGETLEVPHVVFTNRHENVICPSTDTPQNEIKSSDLVSNSVVSNLQFPELEPKKCFSDGFDKGVQFGMQKQRQEVLEKIEETYKDFLTSQTDKDTISVQNVRVFKNRIEQQLNQPKTEE